MLIVKICIDFFGQKFPLSALSQLYGAHVSIIEDIVETTADGVRLLGGRHKETGKIVFPCPDHPLYDTVPLSSCGRLWSFTEQCFPPPSPPYKGVTDPGGFKPYFLGYVEIPDEVIVQARLDVSGRDELRIGQAMDLVLVPLETPDGQDNEIVYAFRPQGEAA